MKTLRYRYVITFTLTVLLGLASRKFHIFPAALGKYPGDILWALMVYLIIVSIQPKLSIAKAVVSAVGFSCLIEFCKLYQAPWIVHFRHTTIGGLLLGHEFSWINLIAYAIGIAIGVMLDIVIRKSNLPNHS